MVALSSYQYGNLQGNGLSGVNCLTITAADSCPGLWSAEASRSESRIRMRDGLIEGTTHHYQNISTIT